MEPKQTPAISPNEMFDRFVHGRLRRNEWTHEAHLITCWVALADRSQSEALAFLRHAIQTHNCGIGIENTASSGYHETLTRYYVSAVAQAMAVDGSLEHVLADPACDRKAALEHWSQDLLFCTEARLGWVEPDLELPPWPIVADDS